MSRRWRRYWFLGGGMALATLLAFQTLRPLATQMWQDLLMRRIVPVQAAVRTALVYPLARDRWLEFSIPPAPTRLRLVSNADLLPEAKDQPQARWRYVVQYQILDREGRLLKEKYYHQETRLTQYREETSGRHYTGAYYLDKPWLPADGRLLLIDLPEQTEGVRLRLRLAEQQSPMDGVVIRVYAPARVADFRLSSEWYRLSAENKKFLAEGNVYEHTLLTDDEKRNLLINNWRPLGPVGVRGREYEVVPLYVVKDIPDDPSFQELFLLPGLPVDPEHDGVIAIPERGGEVALRLRQPFETAGRPAGLVLSWRGRLWKENWQGRIEWDGQQETAFRRYFAGGWLRIQSSASLSIQASLNTGEVTQEDITPKPHYERAYLADAEQTLTYKIPSLSGFGIPFRLDLRPAGDAGVRARVEFLDAGRHRLGQQELSIPFLPSRLDRLLGAPATARISDPSTHYFELPANAALLRLTGDTPLLVSAYDHPPGLPKYQRVPEDAFGGDEMLDWHPGWFMTPPEDVRRLMETGRTRLLTTQREIEELDPLVLQGQYRWQDYLPEQPWRGDYLLTPTAPDEPLRPDLLSGHFCPLPGEREITLDLRGQPGVQWLTPTLLFARVASVPFRLSLQVDGIEHYATEHMGQRGVVDLPPITAGRHRLRVSGGAAEYRINFSAACPGGLQRRLAFRFAESASMIYDKRSSEDESLTARLYTPAGDHRRSIVDVTIDAISAPSLLPRTGWTFRHRRYDLRPSGSPSVSVFGSGAPLTDGQFFSIPINRDLASGFYRISLVLRDGPVGYLSLSRTEPGLFDQRYFIREELFH